MKQIFIFLFSLLPFKREISLCVPLLLLSPALFSQPIHAEATFGTDTFSLGALIPLKITIHHSDTIPIVFPAVTDSFQPFTYVKKEIFSTRTTNHVSIDEGIYYMQCFDLQRQVQLNLVCKYVKEGDTIPLSFESNLLNLQERISENDSLRLLNYKVQRGIVLIEDPFNPYWLITGIGAFIVLLGVLVVILRKPIANYLKRQFIRREWYNIRRQFQKLQLQIQNQPVYFDELNKIWKEAIGKEQTISLRY